MKCPIRILVFGTIAFIAGFVLLTFLDEPIYHAIDPTLASRERLDSSWWYLILRHTGSLWTWLAIATAVLALDVVRARAHLPRARAVWSRGLFITLSAAAGGLGAELAKLIIARERPATIQTLESGADALVYQGYHFRGLFTGFLDGSNLGLPSSHAATAAGGAIALTLLFPRLGIIAIPLALGCGISRLLTGAHFATDVFAGFVLAGILVLLLRRALGLTISEPPPHNATRESAA
ncbi:phosphatase PAP2 family protein [bacterium AH-315-K20]|nr:phosphatase PAP2 family protein [bacterium AH-315-K20]